MTPVVHRGGCAQRVQPPVAIISYNVWKGRFAGDRAAVGRTISLDGRSHLIVGVLPRNFELPTLAPADMLVPQQLDETRQRASGQGAVLAVFGRLKPGVTPTQADAQLQPLLKDFMNFVPPRFRSEVKLMIRSVRDRQVHDAKTASWLLLGAVLAVLLIACANVANLLLARSEARRRELALRAALGAGRARLALLTLSESLTIGVLGGTVGCGLAWTLMRIFIAIAPQGIPRLREAALDLRVLTFALLASLLAGCIFGLAPALQRAHPESLAGWHNPGSPQSRFRRLLLAGQVAGSLVLLFSAGGLLRSLWNVENGPLGMTGDGVLTADITLNQQLYPTAEKQHAFFENLESRLTNLPGIQAMALSDSLPPAGDMRSTIYAGIEVDGRPKFTEGTGGTVVWRLVTPGYFSALRIPILRGRGFREEDRAPDSHAIILGESLSRRLFPGLDPVVKRLMVNNAPPWFTVVGVAAHVRNNGITGSDLPEYYLLRAHAADYGLGTRIPNGLRHSSLIVRVAGDPRSMGQWLRAEIQGLDPALPVEIATLNQRVGQLAQRAKFSAVLLGLFAGMALIMAAVGLYGVVSFFVVQRTREIGVRMALGATPPHILRLVLAYAARWTGTGVLIGLAAAVVAARAMQSMLFHVAAGDLRILGTATVLLIAVALLAAGIPSWRAARVDPLEVLRE